MSKFRYLIGMGRLCIISLFSGGKLKYKGIQKADPSADFDTLSGGRIDIGRRCSFGKNAELAAVEGRIRIGDGVHMGSNCLVVAHGEITVGDGTMFGPHVYIYDHDHVIDRENCAISRSEYETAPVSIGRNCWIGANTVILKGTVIGDNVTVGAGSVVSGSIPGSSIFFQPREKVIKPYKTGKNESTDSN